MMAKRNYNKAIGIVFALLLLALVIMGCETFPKPLSDTDTLFVVPVVYLDSKATPLKDINFGYRLILENVETRELKHVTIDSSDPYKFVKNWDEGEYLLKEYRTLGFKDNWTSELRINQYLKLEKGKVSIFPCKIVIILMERKSLAYPTSIAVDFIPLYEDDYVRIREFLSTYENFHFWKP
jgi:hypothetical protein